ncbi:DarT ssDNA thymidine ADP-ribosyltransferase family protein [Streptomyces rubiginosohelvolus]|uniref:DarT ssDNA thymidine ADP-ribosyltransferase family protein n=1 Tax=Streptomyces rubiginosohelvolus TaxID=67362 RepID=A0ABW6F602_9ACTN
MTTDGISVEQALAECKATRLAHFTPARNLFHIVRDGAIRSSSDLAESASGYFSPTDKERFDRNPDKVCCTFEYPNGYYLAQAKGKPDYVNYPDWVCFFLDVDLACRPGTLFAPCNAAKQYGAFLKKGGKALRECFSSVSDGWPRGPRHLVGAATNLQAEVLIPGPIAMDRVMSIAVPTPEAASTEFSRLKIMGLDPARLSWVVSPTLFDKFKLSNQVRNGGLIAETSWVPPQDGEKP